MSFQTRRKIVRRKRRSSASLMKSLSKRLFDWRKRNDLSQSEAALKLRISKRTLQEWEQGRAEPAIWRGTPSRRLSVSRVHTVCSSGSFSERLDAIRDSRIADVVIGSETEVRYFQQDSSRKIRLDEAQAGVDDKQVGSRKAKVATFPKATAYQGKHEAHGFI